MIKHFTQTKTRLFVFQRNVWMKIQHILSAALTSYSCLSLCVHDPLLLQNQNHHSHFHAGSCILTNVSCIWDIGRSQQGLCGDPYGETRQSMVLVGYVLNLLLDSGIQPILQTIPVLHKPLKITAFSEKWCCWKSLSVGAITFHMPCGAAGTTHFRGWVWCSKGTAAFGPHRPSHKPLPSFASLSHWVH